MKKITLILFVLLTSLQINAQSKVGTIDVEFILSKMPQLEQVGKDVKAYNADLDKQVNVKISKYQSLIEVYKQNENTFSDTEKKTKQDEIIALEKDIQKFQQNATKLSQIKQNELLGPLYQKIGDALNVIAKENNYSQVFTIDNSIAYLDANFDITLKVMTKLGLPLPEQGK